MSGSGPSKTKTTTSPDYVQRVRSKGKIYTYYRRDGQRVRIEGEPGSPDWFRSYAAIHESFEQPGRPPKRAGSLAALIEAYKGSPDYKQLGKKTRKDYDRYMDRLAAKYGDLAVATMPRAFVFKLRDKHAKTPRTANYYVQVLRLLLSHAVDHGWRQDNPALRPKQLRTGPGHKPWEEWQIAAFRKRWKPDTLQRVAFELLLNTGQRGQDLPPMTRNHYRRGVISVVQQKTGERVEIPASDDLKAVLGPWLKSHDHFMLLTTPTGRPLKVDYLRHLMADAYVDAGLEGVTSHGLRYTAATILAELGCDGPTISSIIGHRTAEMIRKYTRKKRQAKLAITKLNNARKKRNKAEPPQDR